MTKTSKTSAAKTNTAAAAQQTIDDAKINGARQEFADATDGFWSTLGAFWQLPAAPSATMKIVELVSRVVLYALGAVATCYVVSWLSAAMMAGGIPLFLIMVCEIVTLILGILASWHASDAVVDYLAAGHLSRDAKRVGSWFASKFTSTSTFIKTSMAGDKAAVH